MKSLPPKDYRSLPALDAPAGYICVIRDIDRDRYRIEATHLPQALIGAVIAERERSFGIELVALLQTDDLPASEADLYARHHARPSSAWLELDALQVEELRQSMLQIDAYASHYLTRANLSHSKFAASAMLGAPASRRALREHSQSQLPDNGLWKRRRPRAPILNIQYGAGALRRSRRSAQERQLQERDYRVSTEDRIKEIIGQFLLDHIIKISLLAFVIFFMLLAYLVLSNT